MKEEKYEFIFERLGIWQLSVDVAVDLYKLTKGFPKEELYGIVSQIRRAATSVSANLAEGRTRKSNKEKARFFEIAYGSAMEVMNFIIISERLGYIDQQESNNYRIRISELTNKINSYYNKL
ncbi:MAG: four helix bundle protein [Bacteroidota bacterium]